MMQHMITKTFDLHRNFYITLWVSFWTWPSIVALTLYNIFSFIFLDEIEVSKKQQSLPWTQTHLKKRELFKILRVLTNIKLIAVSENQFTPLYIISKRKYLCLICSIYSFGKSSQKEVNYFPIFTHIMYYIIYLSNHARYFYKNRFIFYVGYFMGNLYLIIFLYLIFVNTFIEF